MHARAADSAVNKNGQPAGSDIVLSQEISS